MHRKSKFDKKTILTTINSNFYFPQLLKMSLENGYSTAQEPTTKIEQKKQQSEQKNTIETPIPTEQSSEQLENNKKLNELKNKFPLLSELHLNQNQISTLIFLQEKLQNLDIQNPDNEEIVTDLQKLNQILQNPTLDLTNRKNQLNILLAKLQPIADKAIFDELRSSLDQQRVDQKKNLFLAKFNLQSQGQLLEEKGKQVGRLTLEAFLDDALSDPNFITNSNTITELYSSREDRQIDTFSKINAEKFKSALISASNNAEDFKKPAQIAILKIQNDPSLSSEQKQHLISAENQKWITAAKEANGMLNRQELVIAALSNYNPPRNEAEYIKKLQIIGQEYFNNKLISIDGHWGPQTQTVVEKLLEDFKINPRFEQIAANLQRILKTHRKHNTEKVKTTFAFKMEANIFDTHQINDSLNAKNKENPLLKQNKENKNQKADSIAHSPSNSDEAKKQLSEHSFQNISETTLESSIPKDQESKAIQSFLAKVAQQFEQNGNEYLETEEFHKLGPKAIETAIRN